MTRSVIGRQTAGRKNRRHRDKVQIECGFVCAKMNPAEKPPALKENELIASGIVRRSDAAMTERAASEHGRVRMDGRRVKHAAIREVLNKQRDRLRKEWGREATAGNRPVFPSSLGGILHNATANKAIARALKKLEAEGCHIDHFSAHALRDTFATRFIERGGTPQTLKSLLGHSSLRMTMDLYAQVLPNTKQKEMDAISILGE